MSAAPLALAQDADPDAATLIAARAHLSRHAMDGLVMDGVPLAAVAASHGTPSWVYSADAMRRRVADLAHALGGAGLSAHIHYAVKANGNLAVIRTLHRAGCGADVVSLGEFLRARAAGVPPADIVFSGVGKTLPELTQAIAAGVGQVNAESAEEIGMLAAAAAAAGTSVDVALRVNPDVDAGTHAKITTGRLDNKFGIAAGDIADLYARLGETPGLRPAGLAVHIGSQIGLGAPYLAAYARVAELARQLLAMGLPVPRIDCGGGLAVGYRDGPTMPASVFAGAIAQTIGRLGLPVMVEPGRWLVAEAGLLLASVVLSKRTPARRFVVLDAAMNDLLRPAMYDAWHGIVPVAAADLAAPAAPCDVVGPVCETGDTFARLRALPALAPGALVALLDAGAYGAAMSSTYNARPLAAEVLVDGSAMHLVRRRQAHDDLWRQEILP